MNPGPDTPSSGREFPSLEKYPPPVDPNATVNYPADADLPSTYPASFHSPPPPAVAPLGLPPSNYPQPNYPQPIYPPASYPPPPGVPLAGHPQYPTPYPYAYDPYGRPPGTNGKAIASLVTSVVGMALYGVPSIVGLILGIMAMRETKQTGQEGYGLALAGVIVGALAAVGWLVVLVIVIFAIVVTSSPTYR